MKLKKLDTVGAVSMLSVSVFAIIITVIATVYIRSVTIQQRNALNFDQGTRALYTSLAGFEDTKRFILDGTLAPDADRKKAECLPEPTAANQGIVSQTLGLNYTCQKVNFGVKALTVSQVTTNESYLFPIQPFAPPASANDYNLRITWTPGGTTRPNKTLPTSESWVTNANAPMLRTQVIRADKTLSRNSLLSRSYFLNPSGSADTQSVSFSPSVSDWTPTGSSVRNVVCSATSCSGLIGLSGLDFAVHNAYVVIKPVYRQADVSVELVRVSNGAVLEMSGQAEIDITASSGTIFKRTKQSIAYGTARPQKVEFPDFSIVGGDGLCKQVSLTNAAAGYQQGCLPEFP